MATKAVKWGEEVQDVLTQIEAVIENDTARLVQLTKQRDDFVNSLRELGPMDTEGLEQRLVKAGLSAKEAETVATRGEYVVCLFSIKHVRSHIDAMNDRMRDTIRDANQGKLSFHRDDFESREPTEADLFTRAVKPTAPEDQEQSSLPVGEDGAALNGEARAVNDGYTGAPGDGLTAPETTANVKDLDLDTKIADKLIRAGVTTIGALLKLGDGVEQVKGISDPQAAAVRKALRAWQKNQNAGELATA